MAIIPTGGRSTNIRTTTGREHNLSIVKAGATSNVNYRIVDTGIGWIATAPFVPIEHRVEHRLSRIPNGVRIIRQSRNGSLVIPAASRAKWTDKYVFFFFELDNADITVEVY